MQQVQFLAYTDLEIGDTVLKRIDVHSPEYTIHDIRTVHYLRTGKVVFEFQIKDPETGEVDEEWYTREELYGPLNELEQERKRERRK